MSTLSKYLFLSFFAIVLFSCNPGEPGKPTDSDQLDNESTESTLWPEIEPYKTDSLEVSELHTLYYELSGNPDGIPVFGLHGGPGGRSSPYMRRFFDPKKYCIILHDQRGCGKSTPYADVRENNTQALVSDIEKLRIKLGKDKIILFGGSWGSTLALAYAEEYPHNVAGMVMRGIFTSAKDELDYFYHGGVRTFFPDTYDKFISQLPDTSGKRIPDLLLELIQKDSVSAAKYSRIWAEYEIKISSLDISDKEIDEILEHFNPLSFGLLENWYMSQGCFFEERQLLVNAYKLEGIPMYIVNGRYDAICPPRNAWRLHKACPWSEIYLAPGSGHWMGEPAIEKELIRIMKEWGD